MDKAWSLVSERIDADSQFDSLWSAPENAQSPKNPYGRSIFSSAYSDEHVEMNANSFDLDLAHTAKSPAH